MVRVLLAHVREFRGAGRIRRKPIEDRCCILDIFQNDAYLLSVVLGETKRRLMEKKTASSVSVLLIVIFFELIYSHGAELYVKHEHTPETPYFAPDYLSRPIVTMVTTSTPFR
jgi:hypothetical protein